MVSFLNTLSMLNNFAGRKPSSLLPFSVAIVVLSTSIDLHFAANLYSMCADDAVVCVRNRSLDDSS